MEGDYTMSRDMSSMVGGDDEDGDEESYPSNSNRRWAFLSNDEEDSGPEGGSVIGTPFPTKENNFYAGHKVGWIPNPNPPKPKQPPEDMSQRIGTPHSTAENQFYAGHSVGWIPYPARPQKPQQQQPQFAGQVGQGYMAPAASAESYGPPMAAGVLRSPAGGPPAMADEGAYPSAQSGDMTVPDTTSGRLGVSYQPGSDAWFGHLPQVPRYGQMKTVGGKIYVRTRQGWEEQ